MAEPISQPGHTEGSDLEQDRRRIWIEMLIEDNKNVPIRSTDRADWATSEFDKRFKRS